MAGKSQKPVRVDQLALPAFQSSISSRGDKLMGNPLVRFMVEDNRLLAVIDPFAIENTEELEGFAQRLIAEAIEERHRRGLSRPVPIEAEEPSPLPQFFQRRLGLLQVLRRIP
jgi:hypothetical protein